MAKFALFSYPAYYPSGGMGDYVASFDTQEEAENIASTYETPGYQLSEFREVVNCETMEVVGEWSEQPYNAKTIVRIGHDEQ